MKVVRTVILSLILVFLAFVIYRAAKGGRKIPASTIRAEYRDIESKLTIPGVIQPSKEIDIKIDYLRCVGKVVGAGWR